MLGLLLLLAQGFVLATLIASWYVARRIRVPPRRTFAWALARGVPGDPSQLSQPREFEEWALRWGGLALPVWDIPGDDAQGPTIVLTPGWADSRIGALVRVPSLLPVASRVLCWDPPGLGDAPKGSWSLGTREHEPLLALVAKATGPVVLYGWSAGAGSSIVAAAQAPERIAGVVAEAPYRQPWTPAFRVLRAMRMPWRLNGPLAFAALGVRLGVGPRWRGFDRAQHAARLRTPLLVIHGDADEVCPIEDGRAIACAAPNGAFAVIEGAGHNDLWTDERFRERCARAAQAFVRSASRRHRNAASREDAPRSMPS